MLVPYIIEDTGRGERSMDIYSRLLKDRIIFIGNELSDQVANIIVAQFLFLKADDPKKDINVYINSPGGNIIAGLAIYDTMLYLGCVMNTYCIGQAGSMGAVLLSAGTKGKRFALPNSLITLHQPYGEVTGSASDIGLRTKTFIALKGICAEILSKTTGQSVEKILEDSERDYYMDARAALDYGLIDKILVPSPPKVVS